jgi:hypothetical protein
MEGGYKENGPQREGREGRYRDTETTVMTRDEEAEVALPQLIIHRDPDEMSVLSSSFF